MIGDRCWQWSQQGAWTVIEAQPGLWDHVRTLLPHAPAVAWLDDETSASAGRRWYDPGPAADMTLLVDPASGAPRQLRQVARATGLTWTVDYSGWNVPVTITPPDA